MKESRILSHEESRTFYDAFGSKQDLQRFYEDKAIDALLDHSFFERANAVVEFGCGTGRLAERLLREKLSARATYDGFDVSPTMVGLAAGDRFLLTYVLDLLGEDEIRAAVMEAERVLAPEGLLCLASLTFGRSLPSRIVSRLWTAVHSRSPRLVGGCRPLRLEQFIPPGWLVAHREVVCSFGICTEVLTGSRFAGSSAGREVLGEGPTGTE